MGGPHRSARRALLVLLGVAAGVLSPPAAGVRAQPFPSLESPEPPLAGPPPVPVVSAPAGEPADPPTPWVSLHVRAPATAAAGQEVDYRILVENRSPAAAHHVLVRVPAPAAAFVRASPEPTAHDPQIAWDLGTLPPSASKEILLTLKPGGAGDVDVTARVQFEHGETVHTRIGATAPATPVSVPSAPEPMPPAPMPPAPAPMPPAPMPRSPDPKPALRLRKTGPAQAVVGDLVPFQLNVTNAGTAEATDVEITDSLPPGLELWSKAEGAPQGNVRTWKIGVLTPGETAVRDYEAFAKQAGDQENIAQVTAAGGLRETASWRVRVNEPKLTVAVKGPQKRLLNRPARYQITVANAGAAPLAGVEASVELPAGVDVARVSDDGRREDNRIHWLLGDAPVGATRSVTIEVVAKQEVEAVLRVNARARGVAASPAEIKTLFEGAAGLRVEIDKSQDPLPVGQDGEYTIRIRNGGTGPARNLQLTATAPEQMQFTGKDGPTEAAQAGQTLTFGPLASLGAGMDAIYKVRLRAVRAGEVKLLVEVNSEGLATPLHEEETTTIFGEPAAPAQPPAGAPPPGPPLPGPPPPPGP